jgi:hypothetical protein|nr:hypothetical protein [uncultured Fusobacterium sp.]
MEKKEKNLNIKITQETLDNLKIIQDYYSEKIGVRFSQREALIKLINETSTLIENVGETYPGRVWNNLIYEKE